MVTNRLFRGPAWALLAVVACGGPAGRMGGDVDPFNGVVDNTLGAPVFTGTNTTPQGSLATIFQPTTPTSSNRSICNGNTSCYLPQIGFYSGHALTFYTAGVIKPLPFGTVPPYLPTGCRPNGFGCSYAPTMADHRSDNGGGWHADIFPHSCKPAGYNPVLDAYTRDQQFPIVSALPANNIANTEAYPALGVVAVHGVTAVGGETCNDLKYYSSVGTADAPGHFGSVRSAKPTGYEAWFIFDPGVAVLSGNGGANVNTNPFWYNGLLGAYLSGGAIPVDASGNLATMDGVIVDSSSGFSNPTNDNVVILPYQPGDDGYSPLVRLHDFHTSKKFGFFTGLCQPGTASCPANFVNLGNTCATGVTNECVGSVFNTIVIVASPQ